MCVCVCVCVCVCESKQNFMYKRMIQRTLNLNTTDYWCFLKYLETFFKYRVPFVIYLSIYLSIYTHIYNTHIHTHTHIYIWYICIYINIYIYIYIHGRPFCNFFFAFYYLCGVLRWQKDRNGSFYPSRYFEINLFYTLLVLLIPNIVRKICLNSSISGSKPSDNLVFM